MEKIYKYRFSRRTICWTLIYLVVFGLLGGLLYLLLRKAPEVDGTQSRLWAAQMGAPASGCGGSCAACGRCK